MLIADKSLSYYFYAKRITPASKYADPEKTDFKTYSLP